MKVPSYLHEKWDSVGKQLFDVKSQHSVIKCAKEGFCFDETFYLDQLSERKLQMLVTKVAAEYVEEKTRMRREATKQSRKVTAYADIESSIIETDENVSVVDCTSIVDECPF